MTFWLPFALALAALGEPELPGVLREDPRIAAAWQAAREGADPAVRRDAAATVLEALASIPAVDRLDFLLDCQGSGALLADLEPAFRLALDERAETRDAVRGLLLDGRFDDANRERGALAAAGWMGFEDAECVGAIGAAMGRAELRASAAEALRRITGREFSDEAAFAAWWEGARAQDRAAWLASALEEQRGRALRHWMELLEREPSWGIGAVRDPSPAVRRLGYEALARLEPAAGLPADAPAAAAVREAFATEPDPELRLVLVGLVARFLAGQDAVALLDRALASPRAAERLRAVEQLGALRDRVAAWERLNQELWRVYPFGDAPRESLEFRGALWNALNVTLAADAGFLPEPDAHLIGLMIALLEGLEPESSVRGRAYALLARYPQPVLRQTLLRHAADGQRLAQDRAAALESATGMYLRAGETEALRAALPALLADAAPTVRGRAIRGLARLGGESDLALLAARLGGEPEPALQGELLRALRERPSEAMLEPLLAFAAPPELHAEQVRALQAVIARDFGALERAVAALSARDRADGAYALAQGFAREGLAQELLERHDRMIARTQADWLLRVGVGGADAARAADALGFLADLEGRWPQEEEWPRLQAELALLLGRHDTALTAAERWLALGEAAGSADRRWELGLRVARVAAAGGFFERGWNLLTALGPPPESWREAAAEVRNLFPPPAEPPAPEKPGQDAGAGDL